MKRFLSAALAAAIVCSLSAGCSSQAPSASGGDGASPAASGGDAASPAASGGGAEGARYPAGTFLYSASGLPQYRKVFYDDFLSRAGERGADVQVEYQVDDASSQRQKLILGFTSGAYDDLPDVVFGDSVQMAGLAEGDMLLDVTEFLEPLKGTMVDGAFDGAYFGGRIVAFPDEVRPQLLYYSTAVFDAYGIDPERCDTIEGWLDVGRELKEKSGGEVYLSNYDPGKNTWRYFGRRGLLPQAQAQIWDEQGGVVFGSDPGVKRALGTLATLKEEEMILAAPWMQPPSFDAMRENKIATLYIGAFYDEHIRKNVPDQAGVWRVRPAPVYEDIGLRGAAVSTYTAIVNKPDAKYAQLYKDMWEDFNYNYGARKQWVQTMIDESGPFSNTIVKEALEDPFWQQESAFYGGQSFMRAEFEGLENSAPNMRVTPADAEADAIISPEIEKFLAGEQSIEQAIANADTQLKAQLGGAQ